MSVPSRIPTIIVASSFLQKGNPQAAVTQPPGYKGSHQDCDTDHYEDAVGAGLSEFGIPGAGACAEGAEVEGVNDFFAIHDCGHGHGDDEGGEAAGAAQGAAGDAVELVAAGFLGIYGDGEVV